MYHPDSSHPFHCDEVKQIMDKMEQFEMEMKKMRDEMKPLINESKSKPDNIWSVRNIFVPAYLDGLRELASESLIVKVVWFSILLIGLIILAYQVTEITRDYVDEVTVTQISQIETNFTELNRPSICFTVFPGFLYRQAGGGSFDDLEPLDSDSLLYLGYIKAMVPHFATSGLWLSHVPAENITWSQFQSLEARSWLPVNQENASLLSQNTLYDSLYYWGIGRLNAASNSELLSVWDSESRSRLSHVPHFYSEILSKSQSLDGTMQYFKEKSVICVPCELSTLNIVTPGGKGTKFFTYGHYFGEPTNVNTLHQIDISVVYFNTKHFPLDTSYVWSKLEPDIVYKHDTANYFLMPIKYEHRNLSRRKCYDAKGEIYPRGYGENICFHNCLWEKHARLFNCSFWEDFNEHPSMRVCHIYDIFEQVRSYMSEMCSYDGDHVWCNAETSDSVDVWNRLILQIYRDKVIDEAHLMGCKKKCTDWRFCDEWELEYGFLYKHEIAKQITSTASNWSGIEMYRTYTISYFASVNKEVLKASLEEFMASLGGTIGLYFGFSICGCLHLLLFLSVYGIGKAMELRTKRHSQVANDQPITNDTPNNASDIEMVEIEKS